MKHFLPIFALAVFVASALPSRAVPIKAQLILNDEARTEVATFVVSATENGLMCSAFENGQNPKLYPFTNIKDISWVDPADWKAAWDLFNRNEFKEAAVAMGKVYDNYAGLKDYEDSYASRAKFYQCESLRLDGDYAALTEHYPVLKGVKLSAHFAAQASLYNCWGHAGKELWKPLSLIMAGYEIDVAEIPAHTVPPTGLPFKKVSPREIIQIAYLRGLATDRLLVAKRAKLAEMIAKDDERLKPEISALTTTIWDETMRALTDYSRAMTVTFGDEKVIMKNAMLNYFELATTGEGIKDDYIKQKETYVVALLYSQLFGKLPEKFKPLLEKPKEPADL